MTGNIPQEILDLESDIAYENPEGWKEVRAERVEYTSRWNVHCSRVIGKGDLYYEIYWARGATEMQDNGVEDLEIWQVEPVEVVVTKYKRI